MEGKSELQEDTPSNEDTEKKTNEEEKQGVWVRKSDNKSIERNVLKTSLHRAPRKKSLSTLETRKKVDSVELKGRERSGLQNSSKSSSYYGLTPIKHNKNSSEDTLEKNNDNSHTNVEIDTSIPQNSTSTTDEVQNKTEIDNNRKASSSSEVVEQFLNDTNPDNNINNTNNTNNIEKVSKSESTMMELQIIVEETVSTIVTEKQTTSPEIDTSSSSETSSKTEEEQQQIKSEVIVNRDDETNGVGEVLLRDLVQKKSDSSYTLKKPERNSPSTRNQRQIGSYKIGGEIGRGANGVVFKAIHIRSGDIVAIKQVNIKNLNESARSEVMREIQTLKTLDSEHVVKYHKALEAEGKLYIILDYIEGGSLHDIVKKFGVFPESLAKIFTLQILKGVEYLHSKGVIHRDIKGANVLIEKNGMCKLADFGAAAIGATSDDIDDEFDSISSSKKFQTFVGTPYWMSPEVILRSGASKASDIWSIGCTVIEMITGKPPYFDLGPMSAMFQITSDDHPPIPNHISQDLVHFLYCCFSKNPEDRYSAKQLQQHPWIPSPSTRQSRSMTIADAENVVQTYNNLHIDPLENENEILRSSNLSSNSLIFDTLSEIESRGDPPDLTSPILRIFEIEPQDTQIDSLIHQYRQLYLPSDDSQNDNNDGGDVNLRSSTSPHVSEDDNQKDSLIEDRVDSVDNKIEDQVGDNGNLDDSKHDYDDDHQQQNYNRINVERNTKHSLFGDEQQKEIEAMRKQIQQLNLQKEIISKNLLDMQNQIGKILSDKKKVLKITKKYQAAFEFEQSERKHNLVDIQNIQSESSHLLQSKTTLLAGKNEILINTVRWFMEEMEDERLTCLIYGKLSIDWIRRNAMEGWAFISSHHKFDKKRNEQKKRYWVILKHNFLFCFPSDIAESPSSIIRLDKCKTEVNAKVSREEEERLRKEIGTQDIVEKEVAKWLGQEETEQERVQKRKKRISLTSSMKKKLSSVDLKGKFCFTLHESDVEHNIGCDSLNSMNMWMAACENYVFWYDDYDFVLRNFS